MNFSTIRNYTEEILRKRFLDKLVDVTIVNEKIRKKTLNSVLNCGVKYLGLSCPLCRTELVDPVELRLENNRRHARCSGCGYAGYTSFYNHGRVKNSK